MLPKPECVSTSKSQWASHARAPWSTPCRDPTTQILKTHPPPLEDCDNWVNPFSEGIRHPLGRMSGPCGWVSQALDSRTTRAVIGCSNKRLLTQTLRLNIRWYPF